MNARLIAGALALTFPLLAAATDWAQLGHDAGRSGATANELRPPFDRKWYRLLPEEGIQSGVQPIVARGRVYVPTLRGRLHAIDAETGEDLWTYDGGGPMLHAAACDGERVYIGTGHSLHAVNVTDGARAWTFQTPVTMWNAPAVHQGVVYFGDRAGKLNAVDAATGKTRWSSPVGGPVLNSPAVDVPRRRVYAGAEDMRVYAFDIASGTQLWKSPKLPGCSFRGYHPVLAPDGSVMVTVTPVAGGDAVQQVLLDMVKEVFGEFSSWRIKSREEKERIRAENFGLMKKPQTYQQQLDYLRKRLTDERALQTFFVLDPQTGKQRFVTPIVYAESMNGPGSPPIVTPDGKVIVKYNALLRSRYEHYSPFLNVGSLDTATGHITPIMDQSRTYGWHDSLLLVHDEQSQLIVGGTVLINTHQDNINAMDLKTLRGDPRPWANNVHEVGPGVAASIWAHVLHGKDLPQGWEWLPRGTAVYGGGSAIDVPIAIAGDSFYYLPTHEINSGVAVIAYRMKQGGKADQKIKTEELTKETLTQADWKQVEAMKWDWDTLSMPRLNHAMAGLPGKFAGTRESPKWEQAKAAVAKTTDDQLDPLILTPAPHRPISPSPHQSALDTAVSELISKTWRPLLFPAGKHPADAYRLFVDPSETLYTLALAYPDLSPDSQAKVTQHVNGPLAKALGRKTHDLNAGEVRSAYDEPPDRLLKVAVDPVRTDTARIYPLWLWAHMSGDWERVRADWARMRDAINPKAEKDEPDLGNGRISGLMAACRIAKHLGDEAALAKLLPITRTAIRDRLEYELAHTEGGLITRQNLRALLGRWRNLNPDLGRLLREFALPVHQRLMDVHVDHHRPAWHVAWNVELLWRNECPFSFPDMSRDIVAARAFILAEDALSRFVDVPWCAGDEYYVQKLAMSLVRWR